MVMYVSGDPTTMLVGLTAVITGVVGGTTTLKYVIGDVPPPGAGFVTETARLPTVAWSATVAAKVRVVPLT
jgi:hypothetical protein